MHRKEFLKACGIGCLGLISGSVLLESCMGTKYIYATLNDGFLEFPINEFEIIHKDELKFRKYIIVQHNKFKYPICVYRYSASEYTALLMRCTHQGTELQVFGDRLQCPAHGSEFTKTGAVQNGPADEPLRTFPIEIKEDILKINLS